MRFLFSTTLLSLLLTFSPLAQTKPLLIQSQGTQTLLSSNQHHEPHPSILSALSTFTDPVDALIALRPGLESYLSSDRLLQIFDGTPDPEPIWGTEGDKLRLRREGKGFMDVTENWELYQSIKNSDGLAGQARTFILSSLIGRQVKFIGPTPISTFL